MHNRFALRIGFKELRENPGNWGNGKIWKEIDRYFYQEDLPIRSPGIADG